MEVQTTNNSEAYSIYPGTFVSKSNPDELIVSCQCHTETILKPRVNIIEREHITEIALSIPGVKKEEIFAIIENGILIINVIHECEKQYPSASNKYERYERNIPLPKNADILFTTAEYQNGVLIFTIPKTNFFQIEGNKKIIIY